MLRSAFGTTLAFAGLLACAAPAAAQQKMAWHTQQSDDSAALVFGVPETDQAFLFFACKPGADTVTVQSLIGSKGLEKDAEARIILSAGSIKKTFAGKAVANEDTSAVDVEATGKLADVKAFAKATSSLSIEVKGAKRAIALTGFGAELAKFETACKPKS